MCTCNIYNIVNVVLIEIIELNDDLIMLLHIFSCLHFIQDKTHIRESEIKQYSSHALQDDETIDIHMNIYVCLYLFNRLVKEVRYELSVDRTIHCI